MRILLDGMGGDNAPQSVCEGAILASRKIDDEIVILGPKEVIEAELSKSEYDPEKIKVVDARDVITNNEAPVKAVRTKKDSTIVRGMNMLKEGEGDVFVSAGSTGALLCGGLFILGRIQGIDRPAIASIYPAVGAGKMCLLVDAGANTECKPNNLLEFGMMGSIYMEKVVGRANPKVGLVNVGAEPGKGSLLCKGTYDLLEHSHLNFVGNVEARELPEAPCDVIVCDGFTGNVILKLTEGLAMSILHMFKKKLTQGVKAKLGGLLLLDKMKGIKGEFSYEEYGGAPILGVKKPVIKMHGSSNSNAVMNAITMSTKFVETGVIDIIQNSVEEIEEIALNEE